MHHDHHILQIIVVWELRRPGHSSILIEYCPVVLVHIQALANVLPLLLTKCLLFDFLSVFDAGRVRDVRLFLVTVTEISLLFLRVYFADLNDKIVRNARYIFNSFSEVRVRRLRLAHG